MIRATSNFRTKVLFAAWILAASLATPAQAIIYDCSTSPFVANATTGNRIMAAGDIIRSTNGTVDCVQLYDGRDIILNGARIECVGSCPNYAVRANASGSILTGGTVSGDFWAGAINVQTVTNMSFDGMDVGVWMEGLGRTVSGCVFRNCYNGVNFGGDPAVATMYVHDNAFENGSPSAGYYGTAINAAGSSGSGPRVEKNLIRNWDGDGIWLAWTGSGTNLRVTDNVLYNVGGSMPIYTAGYGVLTNNICDDPGVCPALTAPFQMP